MKTAFKYLRILVALVLVYVCATQIASLAQSLGVHDRQTMSILFALTFGVIFTLDTLTGNRPLPPRG